MIGYAYCLVSLVPGVVKPRSGELVGRELEVVAIRQAVEEDLVDPVGEQDVVELVEAAELVVALSVTSQPNFHQLAEVEQALGLEAAAPAVVLLAIVNAEGRSAAS